MGEHKKGGFMNKMSIVLENASISGVGNPGPKIRSIKNLYSYWNVDEHGECLAECSAESPCSSSSGDGDGDGNGDDD